MAERPGTKLVDYVYLDYGRPVERRILVDGRGPGLRRSGDRRSQWRPGRLLPLRQTVWRWVLLGFSPRRGGGF